MIDAQPHIREAGSGSGVVCLHANASISAQWRGLIELLAPNHHVLAPDLYGSGNSPDWHSAREIALRDEAAFIAPVLARAGAPLSLVGHSHGAAVALIAALANPGRIRALAVYAPTLFSLVDAQSPAPNGADGIRNAVLAAGAALDAADPDAAARHFIDFWMGAGSWAATPVQRKPAIAKKFDALAPSATQLHYTGRMKTATIPSVRVEPELRAEVESLLSDGETVSEFVEASVRFSVLRRRNQAEFIARGLRSLDDARLSGDYVSADAVIRKLQRKLDAARTRKAAARR